MNNFTAHQKVKVNPIKTDEYYYDMEVKKVVKKTGEGEDDYVLVDKFIISKRNIHDLIQAQAGDVGVYNLLDRMAKTGDTTLMPKEWNQEGIVDFTKMPQDLMEAVAVANSGEALYNTLPDELKSGSIEETLANLTDDQIKAWIKGLRERSSTNGANSGAEEGGTK